MPDKTQVAAMDSGQRNSPIMDPGAEDATLVMEPGENICYWNGAQFKEGSMVESAGITYECTYGSWVHCD